MSLDRNEIIRLLQLAACYANRTPAESTVLAWEESARRGRWTFDEAADAIKNHYLNSTDFIMPGHITQLIRATRQDTAMRNDTPPRAIAPADASGWVVGDDPHFGKRNRPELEALHAETNVVPCRHCKQEPGHRCINSKTGNATKIPHPSRLVDAKKKAEHAA